MAEIRLSGVNKVYPGGTHAVHDVDLHIADGEFMIMVGPSGCAKSTILRMIAGLEAPTGGTVEIGGRVVNDVAPKDRDIAMVFQSYALYPHMTVRENMAFGLRLRKMPPNEIDQRVAEAARILGLENLLDRLPKAMSGGQRQRVAMGRAIVREPQAFLMDEPLSNLDAKLRVQMRTEIAKLHQRLQTTTVYVTHDQVEAMTLGQRICILRKGVIQQVDTPFEVYNNPANVFVGGFIGSPGMNFMNGHLVLHDGILYLKLGEHHLPVPASVTGRLLASSDLHGRGVIVGVRPEHLGAAVEGDANALPVQVDLVETMGAEVYAYFNAGVSVPDLTELSDTQASMDGFVARLSGGSDVQGGSQMWLRPDMDEIHLFDPQTFLTMLAPAEQAEVRARQAGVHGRAVASTQGMRSPVSSPPSSAIVQPMQPVIHLHQTFMQPETAVQGTLPEVADPTRISAVFDQPVSSGALHLQPLMPAMAATATGSGRSGDAYPRPTFADAFAAGAASAAHSAPSSFTPTNRRTPDAVATPAFRVGSSHHEPEAPAPRALAREEHPEPVVAEPVTAEPVTAEPLVAEAVAPEPTATVAAAPAAPEPVPAPQPARGFAPRVIGVQTVAQPTAPEPAVSMPAATAQTGEPVLVVTAADLDGAIDAIDAVAVPSSVEAPVAEVAPAMPAAPASTAFRDALAKVRMAREASTTPVVPARSVVPPPVTLRAPTVVVGVTDPANN
ncbi:MAG: transporter, ATP-binding protein [Thermoleophilia bacterium]|nr:transporter, ATP-binding protein [Thermoleophilia bacterium]